MTLYKMRPSACIRGGQDVARNQSICMEQTVGVDRCILNCHLLDFTLKQQTVTTIRNCSNTDEHDPLLPYTILQVHYSTLASYPHTRQYLVKQ